MNPCDLCAGACCESLLFPVSGDSVSREFYDTRVSTFDIDGHTIAELPCRCPQLTPSGRCTIYPTRPVACSTFKPGSTMCLAAVRRRRPEQADRIISLIRQ